MSQNHNTTKLETVQITTAHGTMQAFVAYPDSSPSPCILVLQEAFGVNDHIKDVAIRFSKQGYVAIAPELFYRTAPPGFVGSYDDFLSLQPHFSQLTPENIGSDLKSVLEWLHSNPNVESDRIASIGYCLGGRASFLANAMFSLKAAVSYYGTRIIQSTDYSSLQRAPLLLVWAGKDKGSKPDQIRTVSDSLRAADKNFTELVFSEAEHGFFCDARGAYHKSSADQAWAMTLAFLKEYV
ncbi:dienelactone hydrolase family protein [Leptospira semungkisensis]|uniref:Dienelactone hydrolase family protein n=1 Tax=Leptospira semungkisensis TaxID=2484985 RepID=A0A4R9G5G6_9LEPT|nr:dienelactone hydrolase family protein [Leptospira semungkisensis]TGK06694.1 dienelactone hydrolase family protein [Leptospira semungkisensis]